MSMTYKLVALLFLASAISAALPPRAVYSAVIENTQPQKIQCSITWSKSPNQPLETNLFTVERSQKHLAAEKEVSMGTWVARATIEKIRCGQMTISAPFDKVTGPSLNWRFIVRPNKIESVGPSA